MTLKEISGGYREAARLIRQHLCRLRRELRQAHDPERIWHLRQRILALTPVLTQMNELAELTEHYYDKEFYRDKKYTV